VPRSSRSCREHSSEELAQELGARYAPGLREGIRGRVVLPCVWVDTAERLAMMLGRPAAELAVLVARQVEYYSLSPQEAAHEHFERDTDLYGQLGHHTTLESLRAFLPEAYPEKLADYWRAVYGTFMRYTTYWHRYWAEVEAKNRLLRGKALKRWRRIYDQYRAKLHQLGLKYAGTTIPAQEYQRLLEAYWKAMTPGG